MSERLDAICTALEFIEDHLQGEISVADIAAASGYSLYHFIRAFNQIVHHSPYDYLMRRRLSEAADELLVSDRSMLDISLDFGFNNYETFSRAFKRMFAITPSQWQKHSEIPHRLLIPSLTRVYLEHLNGDDFPQLDVVERGETILAGLMIQDREDTTGLWQHLRRTLEGIPLAGDVNKRYGVRSLSPQPNGPAFFLVGAAIATPETIPPTLVVQTLPAGDYLRFTHRGQPVQCSLTLDYVYHTWLPNAGLRLAFPLVIEHVEGDNPTDGAREIYLPVEFVS
jgi:AraC family transcriptional regulator